MPLNCSFFVRKNTKKDMYIWRVLWYNKHVTNYKMKLTDIRFIEEKVKNKKDGVYTIRGIVYRVRDHKVTHWAHNYEIFESNSGWLCKVGTIERVLYKYHDELAKKELCKIK